MTEIGGVREVKSAARTIELLEHLASRQDQPTSLREISDALGAPRSSVYALLRTLSQRGWVRTDQTGTLYGIGIGALMAGTSYLDIDPHLRLVRPWLDELKERMDETVHMGRLDGADIVYLATRESTQYLREFSRIGRRLPASATALGKSLLALLPEGEALAHLHNPIQQLTPNTITDRAVLMKELAETRARGYAIDDEENTLGFTCFAFALRYSTPTIDAISCSVPTSRITPDRVSEIVSAMEEACGKIERFALSVLDSKTSTLPHF